MPTLLSHTDDFYPPNSSSLPFDKISWCSWKKVVLYRTKTLSYFWFWCLVLPLWSMDPLCSCGLAAYRGSSLHVWTKSRCSSSWTVSDTSFYTILTVGLYKPFSTLLPQALTVCCKDIIYEFLHLFMYLKVQLCSVKQMSTSLFNVAFKINFLVSFFCYESIFTGIKTSSHPLKKSNACWNVKVLWKYISLLFQVISFELLFSTRDWVPFLMRKMDIQELKKKHVLKVWWSVLIFETFPQSKRLFFYRSIALFCNFSNLGMIHVFMCEPSTVPKWIVHLQNKTVPNLMSFQTCDFPSPLKNKRKYFKECC